MMENNNVNSKRMSLINSLMDIRLILSTERIFGSKIRSSKLKAIIESEKNKNVLLIRELDNVFDEYFNKDKIIGNNNLVSLYGTNDNTSNEKSFSEISQGRSFVKRDSHFNSNTGGNREAA